jgi:hypothetical protein
MAGLHVRPWPGSVNSTVAIGCKYGGTVVNPTTPVKPSLRQEIHAFVGRAFIKDLWTYITCLYRIMCA